MFDKIQKNIQWRSYYHELIWNSHHSSSSACLHSFFVSPYRKKPCGWMGNSSSEPGRLGGWKELWTHRQPWVKKKECQQHRFIVTHVPIGPWWIICDLFRFSMWYIPHFCDQTLRDNISECSPSVMYWGESYFQCHCGCVGHMKRWGDIWCFPVKYTLCIVGALHPSG